MTLDEVTGDTPANDGVTGGARTAASTMYDQVGGPRPLSRGKGKKPQAPVESLRPRANSMYAATDPRMVADEPSLAEQLDAQARVKYAADKSVGFTAKVGAAYQNEMTPYIDALVRTVRPSTDRLDVAWRDDRNKNWEKYFAGYTDEEQELLQGANNKDDWEHRVERIKTQRENAEVLSTSGTAGQIGYGLLAGIANPVNWAAGIGMSGAVAKLGMSSTQLALQGRKAAAVVSNVAENVVGNVAVEGALDLMGEHKSMYDYGAAAMMGLIPSTVTGPLAYKQAQESLATKIRIEGEMRKAKIMQQAIENVGKDAPDEVKIKEAERIEREQIANVQRSAASRAKEDDRIPAHNLDELPPEEPPTVEAVKDQPTAKTADEVPVAKAVETEPAPKATTAETPTELPAALAKAAPRYSYGAKQFELSFASDVDRAAYIIAGNKPSKRDGEYLKFVMDSTGYSEVRAREYGKQVRERIKSMAKTAEPGKLSVEAHALDDLNAAPNYDSRMDLTTREMLMRTQEGEAKLKAYSPELDVDTVHALGEGVHLSDSVKDNPVFKLYQQMLTPLYKEFLPGRTIVLSKVIPTRNISGEMITPDGVHVAISKQASLIGLRPGSATLASTMTHELGHMISRQFVPNLPPEQLDKLLQAYKDWALLYRTPKKAADALMLRSPMVHNENANMGDKSLHQAITAARSKSFADKYYGNFEEFLAEQFSKYTEAGARGIGPGATVMYDKNFVSMVAALFKRLVDLFTTAQDKGMLRASESFEQFIEGVRATNRAAAAEAAPAPKAAATASADDLSAPTAPSKPRIEPADEAVAKRNGLDLMPQGTPRERAEFKAVLDIYKQAEKWDVNNPTDEELLKSMLGNNDTFNVALPATIMAISPNPVARMVAGVLLENASGASGRRATAALSKYILEKSYIGHAKLEFDRFYSAWRDEVGGHALKDVADPHNRDAFNRAVAAEMDARLHNMETEPHALVAQAADTLEKAYERMRVAQVDTKTVGWARLPESSRGYMPHVLASSRIKEMTPDQLRSFSDVLSKQFQEIEGFDAKFSEELARTYLNHARVNAFGGHEIPANVHNPAAAEMVRGALEAMGMTKEEVGAAMGRFSAGGAGHTKKRLHLNLNQPFPNADGSMGTLLDLFSTDHLTLLSNYASRVSGEVALANHGVMGSQGLTLLRTALMHGPKDKNHEQVMKAFDQIAAEFLGRPFGDARTRGMDRLLSVTSLVKLGGMGFPQFGESFNGVWAVGVKNTLESIVDMPRLIGEVHAIARGEKVENGVLGSMEQFGGGGEFGLDGYTMTTMHTNPEANYASYGHDSVTWFDRALKTGAHVSSVLSMHRAIHAAQVRGMSEQIVHKALRYIREGTDDKALSDMGFSPRVREVFKAEMDKVVKRDAFGRIKEFDISKISDIDAANEFYQAVVRGSNQIIQGSFIGETGRWTHSDMGRLLSQFRNFPLVALEKQWARNKGNHGVAGALGILVGSMAFAMPVVLARIAFSAQGRSDKDEYLAKQLDPMNLARASLNYVGSSGFAGEVMDLLGSMSGAETGGRKGSGSIVSSVLPAAGYIEDVGKAVHDPTDPYKVAKALPFSRTPFFLIGVNALKE
jgi:hypothetical protein